MSPAPVAPERNTRSVTARLCSGIPTIMIFMSRPHSVFLIVSTVLIWPVIAFPSVNLRAAQKGALSTESTSQGIELYNQGRVKEAIEQLRSEVKKNKQNSDAWYYLGLALSANDDVRGARKAFEESVSFWLISPLTAYKNPPTGEEERAARRQIAALHFKRASDKVENIRRILTDGTSTWHERLETFRFYAQIYGGVKGEQLGVFSGTEVATKARIQSKPPPCTTEAARRAQLNGKVVLRAVLAADGTVKHAIAIAPLDYGITECAIEAAYKIIFAPAIKDGRPVSMFIQLEYNFNLY